MIAAFDVGYSDDGSAQAAAIVFEDFSDAKPLRSYLKKIAKVAEYVPGSFYRRELPCILELFTEIEEMIDIIVVDGYVSLGDRPGLGKHLSESIAPHIAVIGVAKKYFKGSIPAEAERGRSKNPLFVTAHGLEVEKARELIESMHGRYRLPTLLKTVDRLSRSVVPVEPHRELTAVEICR